MSVRRFFFFNDTATTEIYTGEDTLSLHDALPIYAMLIDDLSYIYNSQLASVTYYGASVSVATAMNVAKAYDPNKL